MLLCDTSIQMKNKIFRDHSGFGSSLKQEFKKKIGGEIHGYCHLWWMSEEKVNSGDH